MSSCDLFLAQKTYGGWGGFKREPVGMETQDTTFFESSVIEEKGTKQRRQGNVVAESGCTMTK